MCKILLSINPEHVENILEGTKKYEYRKKSCKKDIDRIIIYSTHPVKKVVGEVEVLEVIEMEKNKLWNLTKKYSGINKKFYDEYYDGKETAVAYKLGQIVEYKKPKKLNDIGVKVAPQSFMYI